MLTKNTDKLRAVVADHIAKDAVVQNEYWDEHTCRGCFIGCLARGNKPELNEQQYGLPVMLQRIAENIFEDLPADEAKAFFAALPDAVGCDGKDLTRVSWQFLAAELRALPQRTADIQAVIDPVIAGMDRLAAGQEWQAADADLAAAAAGAAVRLATWPADALAATWAARAAAWAADADANAAADAAADTADAIADAADTADARRRQRDLLLQLITNTPRY